MVGTKTFATAVIAALVLGGCSFTENALFPALTGETAEPAAEPGTQIPIAPSPAELATQPTVAPAPQLGQTNFEPDIAVEVNDTGTEVGRRVSRLRDDLVRLQTDVGASNRLLQSLRTESVADAQRYNGLIGSIQSRLQVGTTPGNPVLTRQWNESQGVLDKIAADIGQMTNVSNGVADDSSLAAFILESTRATFGLTGAVDEDHVQLARLEDEVNRTVVLIDRLLNELNEDISRQTNFVSRERSNLTVLSLAVKNGELFGTSLTNRAFASAAPAASSAPSLAGTAASRRPLVVIRFDRPRVEYEQPLFTAVSEALDRRPGATFELVAVAPEQGTPAQVALSASRARRNAEEVMRTLSSMGLPANRVGLSATSSDAAQTAEVHVYVR